MHAKSGITLIELAMALIVIGIIVGSVLVGADIMRASEVRATLTQVEQYQSGVDRFFHKFAALPGDMNNKVATSFGFTPRGSQPGEGDGNGIIEGVGKDAVVSGSEETTGETAMFWVDLTTASGRNVNFIEGSFSAARPAAYPAINAWSGISEESKPGLSDYLPAARLGNGNYIYVWSDRKYKNDYYNSVGPGGRAAAGTPPDGATAPANYFGLSIVNAIGGIGTRTAPGLSVAEAWSIDKKIDDGVPTTGTVTAQYITAKNFSWAGPYGGPRPIPATAGTFSTCYDNHNVTGASQAYSLDQDKGNGINCGLSFRFPAPQ